MRIPEGCKGGPVRFRRGLAGWYIVAVRTFQWAAAALTLVACGPSDRPAAATTHAPEPPRTSAAAGLEALVLRVPRTGGPARAYDYARLDSVVWTSRASAPPIARVLAFDEDGGAVAVVDAKGAPRRIELRTGSVTPPPPVKLIALHSIDGAAVYGVSPAGSVTRLTPTDATPWTLRTPLAARDVAPQIDGSVLVVGEGLDVTTLWRVHPPSPALLDTAVLPRAERLVHAATADQSYFASDSALQSVRTRDLKPGRRLHFARRMRAVAPTPSADRVYVALDSVAALQVFDRYTDHDDASLPLAGPAAELRMDPLGRYLLVRPARASDSVWVVALGTGRVTTRARTTWSADLPFVGVDGSIVVAAGPDVMLLDPETGRARRVVVNGARDFWIPVKWNGFRPRAPGLDQPVTFARAPADTGDSILAAIRRSEADTTLRRPAPPSSTAVSRPVVDSAQGRLASSPLRIAASDASGGSSPAGRRVTPPRGSGYTVQFAALLDRDSAHARAAHIAVRHQQARVVATSRGGATVYLVVLGPYPTQAEAEAAGRASNQPNPWVYAGPP